MTDDCTTTIDEGLETVGTTSSIDDVSLSGCVRESQPTSKIPRFGRRFSTVDFKPETFNPPLNSSLNSSFRSLNLSLNFATKNTEYAPVFDASPSPRGNFGDPFTSTQSTSRPKTPRAKPATSKREDMQADRQRRKSFSAGDGARRRSSITPKPLLSPHNPGFLLSSSGIPASSTSLSNPFRQLTPPRSESPEEISSQPTARKSLARTKSFSAAIETFRQEGVVQIQPQIKMAPISDPGRVQVFVRIRPINDDDCQFPPGCSIEDEESSQIRLIDGKTDRLYQFDGIFNPEAHNKEVFKTVARPLVYSALSGFNGILMCYGQTGSGKTYTLMSHDGITVRLVYKCFRVINADKRHKYAVTCSYLQIYQEKIYDLLNATHQRDLSLREHPKSGVYIENLTEYVVHSPKEVLNLLKVGKRRLVIAETQMNRASSRSHAICQLKILKERTGPDAEHSTPLRPPSYAGFKTPDFDWDGGDDSVESEDTDMQNTSQSSLLEDEDDGELANLLTDLEDGVTSVRGKLYICDLAGSERIKKTKASGERLQEAQHINSSLLELGNVIQALAAGSHRSHVPFRNSTLTRLLQEGLSGNCKTRLVVCIAPTVRDVHETKCSLNFGSRAMKVQVMAHVNYEVDYKKLAESLAAKLEAQEVEWNNQRSKHEQLISTLKQELSSRRSGPSSPSKGAHPVSEDSAVLRGQIQALLILELMTLQLFYHVHDQSQLVDAEPTPLAQISVFADGSRDTLLQSMEGLLELLDDFLRGLRRTRKDSIPSSADSSIMMTPDYIGQSPASSFRDYPPALEPAFRFLEHAALTANDKNRVHGSSSNMATVAVNRLKRVTTLLVRLKENVNANAVKYLKEAFGGSGKDSHMSKLQSLQEIVAVLESQKNLRSQLEMVSDMATLESCVYFLLMDKALLSCLLLFKSHVGASPESLNAKPASLDVGNLELKRLLEDLSCERLEKEKLGGELSMTREEKRKSEERLQDLELELKTVRELKVDLESKLCVVEAKNVKLEDAIERARQEKESLEARVLEVDKKRVDLEQSLKNSDNNNARKERTIVDLKNEKVALDSLVTTLKDELAILEKEKVRETEERRHLEEELEDVRDRNIILETEWSCCREENGLLETELTALEEDKTLLEEELAKYRDDVKMLEEALHVLEAQATDYKQEILALKEKEDQLANGVRGEKERLSKDVSALRQEISSLRVERRRFQRDISVSRADKSNTERAYSALKAQRDSLQTDVTAFRQEEKRIQREMAVAKSEKLKLERDVQMLRAENTRLKIELQHADKIKTDLRLLQKNEERISAMFNVEKDKLMDELASFKDKFAKMEADFSKVCSEKETLSRQLRRCSQVVTDARSEGSSTRRVPNQSQSMLPIPKRRIPVPVDQQGSIQLRSVHEGHVSEVEGRVLDLQRRLAFFMTEKEDIQKELILSRERNEKLTLELRLLEEDTSRIQTLLTTLTKDRENLQSELSSVSSAKLAIEHERDQLKDAVSTAKDVTTRLQSQLDDVTEQNRALEVSHVALRDSLIRLQAEAVVLVAENKHVTREFDKVEQDLRNTKELIKELTGNVASLKAEVANAQIRDNELKHKVTSLECENASLSAQLSACKSEEEKLLRHLEALTSRFGELESTLEKVLVARMRSEAWRDQVRELKEANSLLERTAEELRMQLDAMFVDAANLREEREKIERLLSGDSSLSEQGPLVESVKHLKNQVAMIRDDRVKLEAKMGQLEVQLEAACKQNLALHHIQEKAAILESEKQYFQERIDQLQAHVQDVMLERSQLQAEIDFIRQQNVELRTEIAIILEENGKLESELEDLEDDFEKQERQLDSATEETKSLLRQLCSTESKNLQLSAAQDECDQYKQSVKSLKAENATLQSANWKLVQDAEKNATLHDRLLVAELEISRLKSELQTVEKQRRLLVDGVDSADCERLALHEELQGLARALSPFRLEISAAIDKQDCLQLSRRVDAQGEDGSDFDVRLELSRIKSEAAAYNSEKLSISREQERLEKRLQTLRNDREEIRSQLLGLIQDLDQQQKVLADEPATEMEDSMQLIAFLLAQHEAIAQERISLQEHVNGGKRENARLTVLADTASNELKRTQEDLCLATIEHVKLNERVRNIDCCVSGLGQTGAADRMGLNRLQDEVKRLKDDIRQFEKAQENLLVEVRCLNAQLDVAENNLMNVGHFRNVIEANLREYKERNAALEAHLRVIYSDLVEMESHGVTRAPTKTAKLLLETLDLQRHLQNLEQDVHDAKKSNESLSRKSGVIHGPCVALEHANRLSTVSSEFLQESVDAQSRLIAQLRKEKETILCEKSRLSTKLSLYRDDKTRLLEGFQSLYKSLGAYARYSGDLEKKLQGFQIDLKNLGEQAKTVSAGKQTVLVESLTVASSNGHSSSMLCHRCMENVNKKLTGLGKNRQVLGDELLNCIEDNMGLEAAILTFADRRSNLEQDLVNLRHERSQLDSILSNVDGLRWSDSESTLDTEFAKRLWSCGRLSSRSKSMTSRSADSFMGDDDVVSSSSRSHTALGIYTSSDSASTKNSVSSQPVSPADGRAATASPTGRRLALPASRKIARRRKGGNNEAYRSSEVFTDRPDVKVNRTTGRRRNRDSGTAGESEDSHFRGKSLSGFLKKVRSSMRSKRSHGRTAADVDAL